MDNKDSLQQITEQKVAEQVKYETQTVQLAYHEVCMAREDRKQKRQRNTYLVIIVVLLITFTFFCIFHDCASYSGLYVMVDSKGSIIDSNLSPDDVIRILTEFNNGNSTQN